MRAVGLPVVVVLLLSGCGFATSEPPRSIAHDHATLDGSLFDTKATGTITYWFEWGRTAGYGNILGGGSISAGLPNESFDISEKLTGLQPGTAYHFRLCAWDQENVNFKACSADRGFTTAPDDRPVLTVYGYCAVQDGRQLYGVTFTGANFPFDQVGRPPVRIGHLVRFDGTPGASGSQAAADGGDIDFGHVGRFTPVRLAQIVTWLDADFDAEQDPGEATLAQAELADPCA